MYSRLNSKCVSNQISLLKIDRTYIMHTTIYVMRGLSTIDSDFFEPNLQFSMDNGLFRKYSNSNSSVVFGFFVLVNPTNEASTDAV